MKERTEEEGLIVSGRVVLKNPKMYVGIRERCFCVPLCVRQELRNRLTGFMTLPSIQKNRKIPSLPNSAALLVSKHSLTYSSYFKRNSNNYTLVNIAHLDYFLRFIIHVSVKGGLALNLQLLLLLGYV